MSSSLPPQEHDSTFKLLFENPKDILFLVKHVIGYSWAKEIEEDSIELADKEFVDETFKQKRADVIAKARLKDREVYFYILIENQSTVAEDMPERLLKYMIMLWARKIREGAEKLPAIIPIVTYNGLKEKWDVTKDIIDAFEIFKENIFRYELVDLSRLNVVDLFEREEDSLVPVVFYLEQARDDARELTRRLSRIVPVLEKMDEHNRERFAILVKNIIEPRLNERQRIEVEKMTKTLLQGGEKMGEFVSNIARVLDESLERKFNEGIRQGIQQGEYRTKVEIAKKLILKGASDEDIAEVTELDIEEIRKLRKELAN